MSDLEKQSNQHFEVVLVDSDSADNTRDIAQGLAERLPALTVHNMGTRGVSLGRNTGANLAQHERLLFFRR